MAQSTRPVGISIVCFLLGWLGCVGFANAVVMAVHGIPPIPSWFSLFALAYAVTALFAASKLWRMERTAIKWTRGWSMIVVMTSIASIPVLAGVTPVGIGGLLGFIAMTAVLLWLLDRYVSAKLSATK